MGWLHLPRRKEAPVDPKSDPTPFLRGVCHVLPPDRVAHILGSSGRQSARVRRLPAAAVARRVVALGRFADLSVPHVGRRLHPATDDPDPVESAFAQARARPGVRPVRERFDAVARPMAAHQTVGASYRGWRLMAVDGTTLDLPDTPANARAFGRPRTDRADGASPQLRLLALCELGTRAVCRLAIKPGRRGEPVMAGPLLDRLGPGALPLWDRGFFRFRLAERVTRAGAHLLAPDELPAADAPRVYHERREQELAFDELKAHLSGRDAPIRSKAPAGGCRRCTGWCWPTT